MSYIIFPFARTTILRNVYMVRKITDAMIIQERFPNEWIGLPTYATSSDIMATPELWIPQMVAVGSLQFPTYAYNVIQETAISKLLVGNLLLQFDAEKQVKSHEMVNPICV